ncbi:5429_t:CDS:2 [Acaulospora colombiana]|uniref:5429_t:CDS:1 n=1 Tax=Acaulospora colombiana TaxID=27376 RepID=A0ACA9KK05_9GLOM|nr:5429_t:CDS:2 [Acaulospora colombiana]
MGKKSTNSTEVKAAKKKVVPSSSWLFDSKEITISISPIAGVTLLVLLISIFMVHDRYKEYAMCRVFNDFQDKASWITVADHANSESYLHLDNGAFVYRHIYMDEFKQEFDIIDPSISEYLLKYNLAFRLRNDTELDQYVVERVFLGTAYYAHFVEEQKYQVGNGTFVDDGRLYVRWVNDIVRYGMFAGQEIKGGDVLGIYSGEIMAQSNDLEYGESQTYHFTLIV